MQMVRIEEICLMARTIHSLGQFNFDVFVREIMLTIFHSNSELLASVRWDRRINSTALLALDGVE